MNRLRVLRAEKRLTQFKLSILSGIIQSKLSYIENDLIQPNNEDKNKLAKALGVRPEDIWNGNMEGR